MQTQRFNAAVHYGDWKGTSAADGAGKIGPREWLQQNGHSKDGEFLLGMRLEAGESHGVHRDPIFVEFLLAQPGDHDSVKQMIESANGPIVVRRVQVQMPVLEFLGLFKRFSLAFSAHGMLGDEHDYTYLDY